MVPFMKMVHMKLFKVVDILILMVLKSSQPGLVSSSR